MQRKSFRGHAAVKDADQGIAEVVVSAYGNIDHDGDIVIKGASAKQIAGDYGPNPKGLLDHDWSMRSAVAKTLRWWEEDDGLHIEAQYNLEKEAGRDAFSDLKFYGADMEFSVGYVVKESERPDTADKTRGARRVIKEWEIQEWSHVMLGANSDTYLVGAKTARPISEREAKAREQKAIMGSYEHLIDRLRRALLDAYPSEWLWVRGTLPNLVVFEREVETFDGYLCATFQVGYADTETGIVLDEDPVEVTVSEIVEPKALASAALPERNQREDRYRLLVATTRT